MEGRKTAQLKHYCLPVSTDHLSSFCRKTTLTKHFRRWHTDEETSSEEGSDADIDQGMFETMTRPSRYYTDLWPLPGQSAHPPRPLPFQTLVSRPKSTESLKADRTNSASPSLTSNPNHDAAMTSYEYLRARAGIMSDQILVQTAIPTSFSNIPVSSQYTSENGIGTWTSPMDTKPISNNFPEYSSTPTSAQPSSAYSSTSTQSNSAYSPTPTSAQSSSAYFNDSTNTSFLLQSSNTIPLNEPMQYPRDSMTPVPTSAHQLVEGAPQGSIQPQNYSFIPSSSPEQPMPYSSDPHSIPQATQAQPMLETFDVTNQYSISNVNPPQYYGAAPDWLLKFKAEDSWAGVLPTDYLWNN